MSRDLIIRRADRGHWRDSPDPPVACPACGSTALETARTHEGLLLAVCLRPACECWTLFRRAESGAWMPAERFGREHRSRAPEMPRAATNGA